MTRRRIIAFLGLVAFFTVLFSSAVLAGERGVSGKAASLSGMGVEFDGFVRNADGAPNRIFVEVPKGCRIVAGGEFSLAFEGGDGAGAEIVGDDSVRASMRGGVFSISKKGGGNLDLGANVSEETFEAMLSDAEVVESEGLFCREVRDGSGGKNVLSRTAGEGAEAEGDRSAGRRMEPLSGMAAINRGADGEIETVEIPFECAAGKEARVSEGASITLEETDFEGANAERFRFVNGDGNATVAASSSVVRISPAVAAGEGFVPAPVAGAAGGDGELSGGSAKVVSRSGISCGADAGASSAGVSSAAGGADAGVSSAADETGASDAGVSDAGASSAADETGDAGVSSAADGTVGAGGAGLTSSSGLAECPSGQALADVLAVSDAATSQASDDTDSFTTAGDSFRIRYMATTAGVNPNAVGALGVAIIDESGRAAGSFTANLSRSRTTDSGSFTANLPAGTYRLRITARAVQYDVVVAECGAASAANRPVAPTSTLRPSATVASAGNPGQAVISATIPSKTLANTGGPRLSVIVGGVLFVGVGMLLVGLLYFGRSRRSL